MFYMDPVTMGEQSNASADPVTSQDVEIVINRALGLDFKIIDYQVKNFSEEKLGFLGAHWRLIVTVQQKFCAEKAIHTFFLKSIPYNIEHQALLIEESNAFYKETNFYKHIMPQLMSEVKDKSWIAQCYLVKRDALIFEDLTTRNFALRDKLLDLVCLKSAVSGFAKFHAASILAENRLGKPFNELYPEILEECLFQRQGCFSKWYRSSVNVLVAIAKQLGLNHYLIPTICDRIFSLISPSRTRRNVINHGDAKSYNIMFDKSEPLPKCILVDFQLARYAPAMADVAQFIYLNTRRKLREESTEEVLKHYHQVLQETLRDRNPDISVPSFSNILQEYEEMRIVGLITASLYSPISFIEGKRCAEMTKTSDGFEKMFFCDRVDLVLEEMETDANYRVILTEIVTEFVERSDQFLKL